MAKHEKNEILPTLKLNPTAEDENGVKFTAAMSGMQVRIYKIKPANTMYGGKWVASVEVLDSDNKYSVFINGVSENNLIDAFGDDDESWLNQICKLVRKETEYMDKKTKKNAKSYAIVFEPVTAANAESPDAE